MTLVEAWAISIINRFAQNIKELIYTSGSFIVRNLNSRPVSLGKLNDRNIKYLTQSQTVSQGVN